MLLVYLALSTQKTDADEKAASREMEETLEDIEEEINTITGKTKSESTDQHQAKQAKTKPVVLKQASKSEPEQVNYADRVDNNSSDPSGLFSEKSGFGWESYLEPRLDAELIRSASNEMDLALFIIRIHQLDKDSPVFTAVCEVLQDFFQYKDMIFEFGDSGFAGILVNTDIDGAMNASEVLYTKLKDVFTEYEINPVFGIGLTTRSLRLITGVRLLNEAKKAAEKAMEEKTLPIVAFRVNHEKTKQYLAESAEKYVS